MAKGWRGQSKRHSMARRGIKTRQKMFQCSKMGNLKMNPQTYKLRQDVMRYVNRAGEIVEGLPRVNVRITDNHPTALACADMGEGRITIWVSKNAVNQQAKLKYIVFHEILHTAFGVRHSDDPKSIMHPTYHYLSDAEIEKQFKRLAK